MTVVQAKPADHAERIRAAGGVLVVELEDAGRAVALAAALEAAARGAAAVELVRAARFSPGGQR